MLNRNEEIARLAVIRESPHAVERILAQVLDEPDYPSSFTLLGKEWDLHREVFPPTLANATEVMASIIPYPEHGSFLEVGSGTGVISVMAALRGCRNVVALDINERAVENTASNARRHGVSEIVRTLHSDMYSKLGADDKFDMIFWNVPWDYVDGGFELTSPLHHAVFDPAYTGHRAYISGARRHLTDHGRLLLGTADLGEEKIIEALAQENGLRVATVQTVRRIEIHRTMQYYLLELLPA